MSNLSIFSLFQRVDRTTPKCSIRFEEVVQLTTTCEATKAATNKILDDHREGILCNWKGTYKEKKGPYQAAKRTTLQAIVPAGIVTSGSRTKGAPLEASGHISLDIDEGNTPEQLASLRALILEGKLPHVSFCAHSASGALWGSLVAFVAVTIPRPKKAKKALKTAAGITERTTEFEALDSILDLYERGAAAYVKREALKAGVNIEIALHGPRQPRYLAHDASAYFNPSALPLNSETLVNLAGDQAKQSSREAANEATKFVGEIHATDALSWAAKYATAQGYALEDGQRHDYLVRFAIAANRLGVAQGEVEAWAKVQGVKVSTNCIAGPYKAYRKDFGRWSWKLERTPEAPKIEGKPNQRLSDVLSYEQGLGKYVIAPTGSGKTYWAANAPGKKILVAPLLAIVENAAGEYGATKFTGQTRGGELGGELGDFIATTYASFDALCKRLEGQEGQESEYHLFLDEAHNLTAGTSASFQLRELTKVMDKGEKFKSFTLLSGTPIYNRHPYLRAKVRQVVDLPTPAKSFKIVTAPHTLKAAAELIKGSVGAGRFPLVLLNNKGEKLEALKTYIGALEALEGIKFFNADNKTDADFEQLLSNGELSQEVRGIVTTSVIKEGNNIYNPYHYDIIDLGHSNALEVQQLASRPRKPLSVTVTLLKSDKRKTSADGFDMAGTCVRAEKMALAQIKMLEDMDLDAPAKEREFYARQAISAYPIRITETGDFEVDFLRLSNDAFNLQTQQQNANDSLMVQALEAYGQTYQGSEALDHLPTPTEKAAAAAGAAKVKESKEAAYMAALEALKAAESPLSEALRTKSDAHNLTGAEKAAYGRFLGLHKYYQEHAAIIQQLEALGSKQAKFEQFLKRLRVKTFTTNKTNMKQPQGFAPVARAILAGLEIGKKYTSAEVEEVVGEALAKDATLKPKGLEKATPKQRRDKLMKVARLFFDLERADVREGGEKVLKYLVCPATFEGSFLIQSKVAGQNSVKTHEIIGVAA